MAVDAFALILLMLALGKACARLRVLPANAAEVLNLFVLYICLPASILRFAPRLQFGIEVLTVAAVAWGVLAASVLGVSLLARALRLRDEERAVLLLCVPLGNTSFLGYPLTQALLGANALPTAVVYDQFGSFLILSSYGLWVLARYGGDARPTLADMGRRVVRFPPFVALVLALLLMPESPPQVIDTALQRLSEAMLPVVALAVGLSIRLRVTRGELPPLAAGLMLKLALLPALVWFMVPRLGLEGAAARASVLESAMPPMITAAALAISHRLAPTLAAAMVGYGTLLSMLTLPLWAQLLR